MKMKSIMKMSQGVGGLKQSHQARAGGKGTESPRPTRSVVLPRNGSLLGRTPASGAKLGYDNLDYGKIGERKESEGRLRPRRQRQDVKKIPATPCPDCGRMFDKQVGLSVHQARWCKQRVGCNEAERQEYTASDSKSSSAQHQKQFGTTPQSCSLGSEPVSHPSLSHRTLLLLILRLVPDSSYHTLMIKRDGSVLMTLFILLL